MLLLALLPSAIAYDSVTHPLLYDDLLAVFDPVEYLADRPHPELHGL